ncbi:hypothetical protein [Actibacterium sp. D379-3]
MAFVRPEILAALTRWREVLIGLGVAALGLWVIGLGGYVFQGLGGLVAVLGLALAFVARRRLRFHRDGAAPGVVQVTEGQITYLAPAGGGFAALSELREIALGFDPAGRPFWQLFQTGAPPLAIPVSAAGAAALFDVFVALPGADPARILTALDRRPAEGTVTVWRRNHRPALT